MTDFKLPERKDGELWALWAPICKFWCLLSWSNGDVVDETIWPENKRNISLMFRSSNLCWKSSQPLLISPTHFDRLWKKLKPRTLEAQAANISNILRQIFASHN